MSSNVIDLPEGYAPKLERREVEIAIKDIKDFFQRSLAEALGLTRVTAPLLVRSGTGLNDDLNGVEQPVSFTIRGDGDARVEIVQSLAKWKRLALWRYGFGHGEGLYTDMNALRPDEELDAIHSVYVDQWDWEKVIAPEERTVETLEAAVRAVYESLQRAEFHIASRYPSIRPALPEAMTFLTAEELERRYPDCEPKEREDRICKEHGAVFVMGIGADLPLSGAPHDGRAPDYDDWTTERPDGGRGLNGDILVWNPILERAFELSSMGIRVDGAALERQLGLRDAEDRRALPFHTRLLAGELPQTMGGGIGQSRLCMYLLRTAHIGEVAVGIWPDEMVATYESAGVTLL